VVDEEDLRMIRGVHHTAVSTPNLERALAFYRDLLGFEVLWEFAWPAGTEVADRITGLEGSSAKAAMLRAGNIMLELFQYETPVPKPGHPVRPVCDHGITHVCLDVTDLDTEYERLQAAGMVFHCPPQELGPDVRTTYGRDPDGNVIELQEILSSKNPIALDLD
jgi:catechol 2,3-dioxygenase-like lactoylglutathione lyase family enzyme